LASDIDGLQIVTGDIRDADCRTAILQAVQERGHLDILVNNAGTNDDGPIEDQTLEDLTSVIEVNLVSVLDLCRLLARPLFASNVGASVINVASIYGLVSSRGPMAAYNATKGAVISLTRHLAVQWGRRGVRVNALAPGYFPSEMTGFLQGADLVQSINDNTSLGRLPSLDELDGPLLFLAGDASSYVTGQVIVVDGGWTAV
jgi:NAD(P)-dependent dehydrogenase (short-subunit alcohol dehydrogenase family)